MYYMLMVHKPHSPSCLFLVEKSKGADCLPKLYNGAHVL